MIPNTQVEGMQKNWVLQRLRPMILDTPPVTPAGRQDSPARALARSN